MKKMLEEAKAAKSQISCLTEQEKNAAVSEIKTDISSLAVDIAKKVIEKDLKKEFE